MCRKLSVLCRCVSTAPAQSRTHRPSTFVSAWGILQQHALGFHGLVTEWGPTPGTLSHMRRKRCRERLHIGIDLLDLGGGGYYFSFFLLFFFHATHHLLCSLYESRHQVRSPEELYLILTIHIWPIQHVGSGSGRENVQKLHEKYEGEQEVGAN